MFNIACKSITENWLLTLSILIKIFEFDLIKNKITDIEIKWSFPKTNQETITRLYYIFRDHRFIFLVKVRIQ